MVIQRSTVIAFCCLFAGGRVQGQGDWGAQTTATWRDAISALEAVADDISTYTQSDAPSMVPSDQPSMAPSDAPSMLPSDMPSMDPSKYGMEEEEPKQYMACRPGEVYSQSDSDVELVVNYKYELQLNKRGGETDGLDDDSIKPYVTEIERTILDTMIPSICSNGGNGVLAASMHPTDKISGNCGTSCYLMNGSYTVMVDKGNEVLATDGPEVLYCTYVESTRQVFRSDTITNLDSVKAVDFQLDKELCTRDGNAVQPKIESGTEFGMQGAKTAADNSKMQRTIIISVFTVAGAFLAMAALIVGRRMMRNRRQQRQQQQSETRPINNTTTSSSMGPSARAAAAITDDRDID